MEQQQPVDLARSLGSLRELSLRGVDSRPRGRDAHVHRAVVQGLALLAVSGRRLG